MPNVLQSVFLRAHSTLRAETLIFFFFCLLKISFIFIEYEEYLYCRILSNRLLQYPGQYSKALIVFWILDAVLKRREQFLM